MSKVLSPVLFNLEVSTMTDQEKDYHDIPGTYVFDGEHHRKGYHLNMFCMSLNKSANRDEFRKDEAKYLDAYPMTEQQRQVILNRDWLEMLRLGGNIYYTFKLAIFDGYNMQQAGAAMSNTGMTEAEFKQMMIDGGRSIEGNRSKKESK
jgi:protocatechuate 4,5-dioxygenase alpha chain|tara:strand:+ start:2396 stop:2842 length:447 start_codon:yes stop_codon:yes gene_type:complete